MFLSGKMRQVLEGVRRRVVVEKLIILRSGSFFRWVFFLLFPEEEREGTREVVLRGRYLSAQRENCAARSRR